MTQEKESPWKMDNEQGPHHLNMSGHGGMMHPFPDEMPPEEMEFPVPAHGVILLNIQLMDETETLTIDVR